MTEMSLPFALSTLTVCYALLFGIVRLFMGWFERAGSLD